MGVTDGERLWAFRYSTEGTLAHAVRVGRRRAVRALHPENARLQRLRDEDRIVVSEPFADLPGVWHEIPESTVLIVQPGPDEERPFTPRRPAPAPAAA